MENSSNLKIFKLYPMGREAKIWNSIETSRNLPSAPIDGRRSHRLSDVGDGPSMEGVSLSDGRATPPFL